MPQSEAERALLLRDVMDHAVRVQREITAPTPLRRRRAKKVLALTLCIPALAFCAYSWIFKPSFIWGTPERVLTPVEAEADARFGLYLVAQQLQTFRSRTGVFPAELAELGDVPAGIVYSLQADTLFELRTTALGEDVVLRSTDDADEFLASAIPVLRGSIR